jgi:hypothetical protein
MYAIGHCIACRNH